MSYYAKQLKAYSPIVLLFACGVLGVWLVGIWAGRTMPAVVIVATVVIVMSVQVHRSSRQKIMRQQADLLEAARVSRIHDQQLQQADQLVSLGIMMLGVAHEVNNPVNTIMLNAGLLSDAIHDALPVLDVCYGDQPDALLGGIPYPEMRGHLPQLLSDINVSCERIKTIINDLQNASPNQYESVHARSEINRVVRQAVLLCSHIDKQFNRSIQLALVEGLPRIPCSPRRLEQVLVTLLRNAWQSLDRPDGAIHIATGLDANTGMVAIRIRDEGKGMATDALVRVKDPFYTTRRSEKHAGLGATVAHGIIQAVGGTLEYESIEGVGTTVTIRLPIVEDAVRGPGGN